MEVMEVLERLEEAKLETNEIDELQLPNDTSELLAMCQAAYNKYDEFVEMARLCQRKADEYRAYARNAEFRGDYSLSWEYKRKVMFLTAAAEECLSLAGKAQCFESLCRAKLASLTA